MVELGRALAVQQAAARDAAAQGAREAVAGAPVAAAQQLLEAEGMALYRLAQVGPTRPPARPLLKPPLSWPRLPLELGFDTAHGR